jgi:hypothetical protein
METMPNWPRSLTKAAGSVVVFSGSLVLLGWIFEVPTLKSIRSDWATMMANTAIGFILSGTSLLLSSPGNSGSTIYAQQVGRLTATIVALLGMLTLVQYPTGWNLGIDQLVFQDTARSVGVTHPGRMAPNTALNFLLLGSALILLDRKIRRGLRLAQSLTLMAMLISFLALLGYIYGVKSLQSITPYASVALHTVLTFLVLSAGILSARRETGLMVLLTSTTAGGIMARRLLPAAIITPPLFGWLRTIGQDIGLYDAPFGRALLVSSVVVVFSILICRSGALLNRVDLERLEGVDSLRQSEERLRKSHEQLLSFVDQAPISIRSSDAIHCHQSTMVGGVWPGTCRLGWLRSLPDSP